MLALLADAPLQDPNLAYEPEVRRHPRSRRARIRRPARERPHLFAQRQRQDAAVPRDCEGPGRVRPPSEGRRRPRRRGRRPRPRRGAGRFPAPPGPHPPLVRCRRAPRLARGAGGVHRVRHPPGRRRGPASAAPDVAPRPPRARLRQHRLPAASPQRVRPRRRPRAPRARNRRGLGGPGRQAPAVPLQARAAHARLAEAEDHARAGVRRRRVDGAAPEPRLPGCPAPRRVRRRQPRLRRAHRDGIQRGGTAARLRASAGD